MGYILRGLVLVFETEKTYQTGLLTSLRNGAAMTRMW